MQPCLTNAECWAITVTAYHVGMALLAVTAVVLLIWILIVVRKIYRLHAIHMAGTGGWPPVNVRTGLYSPRAWSQPKPPARREPTLDGERRHEVTE